MMCHVFLCIVVAQTLEATSDAEQTAKKKDEEKKNHTKSLRKRRCGTEQQKCATFVLFGTKVMHRFPTGWMVQYTE